MKSNQSGSSIRIPVKLVDGRWEYLFGGSLPIPNDTVGDLVIAEGRIKDDVFLERLKRKHEYKILDVGTELLVALTIKEKPSISEKLRQYLISAHNIPLGVTDSYSSVAHNTKFVNVIVGEPALRQINMHKTETGGVWLQLEGNQPKGIFTSSVIVPDEVSTEPLESLNHAFTRLSETFEPWRKAHTGNIYERVFFKEKNDHWYPLNVLRDEAIATDEHELAKQMWEEISSQLNLNLR